MKKKKKYNQFAVGIFAYNRPSHLKRLFFSISKYNFSNLYIFLDGPKNDLDKINQNEIMLMVKKYPGKIKLIKRNKNLGLKKSLVNGANYLANKHKKFVVIEDDCIPFTQFFDYFEVAFELMKKNNDIEVICSYQHSKFTKKIKKYVNIKLNIFIPWGWGTHSENWLKFQKNKKKYDLPSIYKKIKVNKKKKLKDIWSLDYISYINFRNKNCLYPSHSFIKNIGFDGSGVNSKVTNFFRVLEKIVKLDRKCIYKRKLSVQQKNLLKYRIKYFY